MKQINFLPAELKVREVKQRMYFFMGLAAVIAVIAVIVPWLIVRSLSTSLAAQVAVKEEKISIVPSQLQLAQTQDEKRQFADLSLRTNALNSLAKQEIDWSKVFTLVSSTIPKDVILTDYSLGTAANVLTIKMGGTAPSNVSFASFVETLQANTHLSKVVVDGFTYAPDKGTVTFSITLTVSITPLMFQGATQ